MINSHNSDEENQSPTGQYMNNKIGQKKQPITSTCPSRTHTPEMAAVNRLSWQPHLSMINEERLAATRMTTGTSSGTSSGVSSCSSREQLRWDPDLSVISRGNSVASFVTYSSASCLDSRLSWQQTCSLVTDGDSTRQTGAFSVEDDDSWGESLEEVEGEEDCSFPLFRASTPELHPHSVEVRVLYCCFTCLVSHCLLSSLWPHVHSCSFSLFSTLSVHLPTSEFTSSACLTRLVHVLPISINSHTELQISPYSDSSILLPDCGIHIGNVII